MSSSFFEELKRRNVFRVALIYAIVGWLLMQIGDVMFPALLLPEWSTRMLAAFLILGFPVALIFAWAYEITPEGVKRTEDVEPDESITRVTGRRIDFIIIAALGVAVVFLGARLWFQNDTAPPGLVSLPGKSIAVLPFANRSAAEENAEFFAAGVHDELLTLLSKLGDLKVISRTSVERLDDDLSIPEIGKLLGVATVLEGQVQRAGDRLRINVQLINATAENHLWATTYDRELTAENVFEVQSDIAKTIAGELHVQLSTSDEALLDSVPTRNTEALNSYLLGRQLLNRSSFESISRAARYFGEATALDPEYAQAWAAIAESNSQLFATGLIDKQEYIAVAEPTITHALELDDRLPAAHAQMASLRWREGNFAAAESSFRRALELDSGDVISLHAFGTYLRTTGQPLQAIPVFERALEEDPLSAEILFQLGRAEMYAGDPEKNVQYAQRSLEIDPSSVQGYAALMQAYLWVGRYDLMWPWFLKYFDVDPDDFEIWAALGMYANQLGDPDLADRYIDGALELGPDEPAVLKCYAQVLMQRGIKDEALKLARRALESGLDDRWFSNQVFLRLIRDNAILTGKSDESFQWYRNVHPELFGESPEIMVGNVNSAADLAYLMQETGDSESASKLIDAGLDWYESAQPKNSHGYVVNIVDVQLLTLKGDKSVALKTLQQAVDHGWGFAWRWNLSNPNLDSIRNEAGFQAATAQMEEGMARQLEAVRALPDMGEYDLRFVEID